MPAKKRAAKKKKKTKAMAILSAAGAGVFLLTLGIDKWVRFRFASGRRG